MNKVKIPIYGYTFYVVIYDTQDELKNVLNDKDLEVENFDGVVTERDDKTYLCLRRYYNDGVQYPTPGIIAHEAKHLVNQVFSFIGHRLDIYNDEAECYLLGWIVNRIHECLNGTYHE